MDDERTQLIGTADYPLDPSLAAQSETCPACQAAIAPGEQFCPRCGYQRGSWGGGAEQKTQAPAAEAPYYLEAADGTRYALHSGESVLGRGEVDLQLPDGYLSRRHLKLSVNDAGVSVTDLGSSNGTYIGEARLAPDAPAPLAEGASLRAGQTTLILRAGVKPPISAEAEAAAVEPEAPPAAGPVEAAGEAAAELPTPVEQVAAAEALGTEPGLSEPLSVPVPVGGLEPTALEIAPATSPWVLMLGDAPEFCIPYGDSVLGRKPEKATLVVRGDGYVSGAHARLLASETTLEVTDLGSTNGTYINGDKLEPQAMRQLGAGDTLRIGQTEFIVQYNEVGEARSGEET